MYEHEYIYIQLHTLRMKQLQKGRFVNVKTWLPYRGWHPHKFVLGVEWSVKLLVRLHACRP
jgi:hypothetical protein